MAELQQTRTAPDPAALVLARVAQACAAGAPWLHHEVARRMAQRLPLFKQAPQCWVDWWGFRGGGAEWVQDLHPKSRRIVVEPDDAMRARSRVARPAWWQWRSPQPLEPMLESQLPLGEADLVWANMMLHAVADPLSTLAGWQRALRPDGVLLFATLGPDTLRELRVLYERRGWAPAHTPFVDMHDLGDELVSAGFADPVMDQETIQLTWSSAPALLAELRTLGSNSHRHRFPGLRTPRWRDQLLHELGSLAAGQGRLKLSFEVIYGHAFKASPRPVPGAGATVPLSDMRAALRLRRSKAGGN